MSELITKQAVLNTLDNADKFLDEERTVEKYKELLTECIKALPSAENDGDLISRQAVLDELEKWDWQDLYLPIHFKQILDDVPSVENKGEWIPVSERLPRIADVYRVTRYYPNNVMNPIYLVDACCFDGFDTWYDDNRINHERAYVDNVIAWQENPEPYKSEKPETCKGCLEPCIMYEPDMRACNKKVTERGE